MAEEVGSGYVSLVPSMRNFSKLVRAELKKALAGVKGEGVEVPVIPKFDQKLLDESLRAQKKPLKVPVELEPLHDKVHGSAGKVKVGVEIDRNEFRRALLGLSKDSRSTIHQKVSVDTDKDFIRRELSESARQGGSSAAGIFSNAFSADLPVLLAGAVAIALGAPFIALAAGALVLAGAALGAVFVGAFLLSGDKDLQKGVQTLFGSVKATLTDAAKPLKGPFLEALGILGQAFKDISPDIKTFFKDIAKSGGIQDLARGIGGFIKSFSETGALKKLGQAIGPVLSQIGMALPDIGNAISQFIINITKPEFIAFLGKMLRLTADVIRFVGDAIEWIASFATGIANTISDIFHGFEIIWNAIKGSPAALKFVRDAVMDVAKWIGDRWRDLWNGAKDKVSTTVSSLTTTVKGLPGKITSALGDLGSLLLNSGKAVVQGLINGIRAKLGDLGNMASNMAQVVWNYMMHSPAKEGPLSGSGDTYYSGQAVASRLAAGMASRLPTVAGAAGQLAGAAAFGGTASMAAAAPRATQLEFVGGDDRILRAFKEAIRVRNGGDVQKALGSKEVR